MNLEYKNVEKNIKMIKNMNLINNIHKNNYSYILTKMDSAYQE